MKVLLILLTLLISSLANASNNNVFFSLVSYDNSQETSTEIEIPDNAINRLNFEFENFITCIYQFEDDEFDTPVRAGLMISAVSDNDDTDKNLIFSLFATSGKTNDQLEEDAIAAGTNTVRQSQIKSIFQSQMLPNHSFSGQGYDWTMLLRGQDNYQEKASAMKTSIMTDKEWKDMGKYQGVKMNKWYCFFED